MAERSVPPGAPDPAASSPVPVSPGDDRAALLAATRQGVREGRAAEVLADLAQAIAQAPGDAALAMLASRLVNPSPAAAPVLDALRQAAAAPDASPRLAEAHLRACLAAGRPGDGAAAAARLVPEAERRAVTARLLADHAAASGDHDLALDRLDRAEALAPAAEPGLDDTAATRRLWTFRRDLGRAPTGPPDGWTALGTALLAGDLPAGCWDDLIAAARAAGQMPALAAPLSAALDRPDLRLDADYAEAMAADPRAAAERLAALAPRDGRAILIDTLLVQAGQGAAANQQALAYLARHPGNLALGRRVVARLAQAFDHGAIDALCAAALQALPADEGWARLWVKHLMLTTRPGQAAACIARVQAAGAGSVQLDHARANALLRHGDPQAALVLCQSIRDRSGPSAELDLLDAEVQAALGGREALRATLQRLQADPAADEKATARQERQTTQADWLQVQLDSGDILARVPVAQPRRGVVAVLVQRSPLMLLWSVLVVCALRRRGYATVFLDAPAVMPPPEDPDLAALHGVLDPTHRRLAASPGVAQPDPGWVIDPARRLLDRAGMRLHQAVQERVATIQRRYTVVPGVMADAVRDDALIRADAARVVCDRLADLAARTGQPVLVFGTMTHYAPACVYKQVCATLPGLNYVELNVGYEQYKSNRVDEVGSSVSLANLTRNPDQRISFHTTERAFQDWLDRQAQDPAHLAQAQAILGLDRSNRDRSPDAAALWDRVTAHRARGGRVLCLLGKITYDIAIEEEGGPAHADMADWLNHSIDCVRGHDDVLLLVKPHPYELLPEVADPTELFADLISVDLPDNCVLLGHRWFNLAELLGQVDLVLNWHGTATLEVLAQGKPILVAATWGIRDHPVPVIAPQDRADYQRLLLSDAPPVPDALQQRARLLISYLVSDEVIVPYPYGNLSAMRGARGRRWGWNMDQVERFLRDGDPHVEYLADLAEFGARRP